MKTTVSKWAVKAAGAGAVALLLATPSFAQSRGDWSRNDSNRGQQTNVTRSRDNRSNNYGSRETQRAVAPARFNTFSREREVYRPRFENRDRDFRGGLSINVGGVFRGGAIAVGVGSVPYAYAPVAVYGSGYVRGVVENVDYRDGAIVVRDEASGRLITADLASGYGLGELRSGDYVQLTGQWLRGGIFDVARIDNISAR
ncbi:MAG TPA: hypothetical protein VNN08_02485 [Thermoanaerobaculia bacterium]|nr:hypothetical protein [Thermoanaerobaculia bacterium]